MSKKRKFNIRIAKALLITMLIFSGFALLIMQINFFLLVFAGIFFSVLLNYSASWITRKTNLKYGLSLLLVFLLFFSFVTGIVFLLGPSMSEQINNMAETLPKSISNLKSKIMETEIGRKLINEIPDKPEDIINGDNKIYTQVMGSFATTIGIIANVFVVFITGIFIAANPTRYKKGFISLFAKSFQNRLEEVMDKAHETLSLWMFSKLISMTIVGLLTAIGLLILGIPLPFALALIATIFSFIPNIGPLLAYAPALLIALMQGTEEAIYVTILYFIIQLVESYMITPLVEKKVVSLPPALTILWLLLMGLMTGILGIMLAAPILAVAIVFVQELYVKDYLGHNINS